MATINIEAEQALLGCILASGSVIKEISLRPEHFYYPKHQTIFEAMRALEAQEKKIDLVTVVSQLGENNLLEVGGVSYLTDLACSVPITENFPVYEGYVLDAWKLRQAKIVGLKLQSEVEVGGADVLSEAITDLQRLEETGYTDEFDLRELQLEMMEYYESLSGDITGVTTGYTDMDLMTNGLQDEDLIIIGARPSIGKTAFMLNMATRAAQKQNIVPAIFSLEMPKKSLMNRIYSSLENIDGMKMRNPKATFSAEDWQKLTLAMSQVEKTALTIYDKPNQTVQEMRAKLRRLKMKYPGQKVVAFIDYLQLIKGSGLENRNLEVAEISRNLKLMARDLGIPVVALSQLSRAVEQRQDKRPMMSDLRDSGSVEQDADMVAFLYREDYYNAETELKNIVEVIIGKQRNGPTGTVELAFIKEYNKFVDLAKHQEQ